MMVMAVMMVIMRTMMMFLFFRKNDRYSLVEEQTYPAGISAFE